MTHYALKKIRQDWKAPKLITMGTPFLVISKRRPIVLKVFTAIFTSLIAFFILVVSTIFLAAILPFRPPIILYSLLIIVGVIASGYLSCKALSKRIRKLDDDPLTNDLITEDDIPIYSLTTSLDEANIWLFFTSLCTSSIQFDILAAGWVLVPLIGFLLFLGSLILELIIEYLGVGTLAATGMAFSLLAPVFGLVFLVTIVIVVGISILFLVASYTIGIIRTSKVTFGEDSKLRPLLYKIRVSRQENIHSECLDLRFKFWGGGFSLNHSLFYKDILTCEAIAQKVKKWEITPNSDVWYTDLSKNSFISILGVLLISFLILGPIYLILQAEFF